MTWQNTLTFEGGWRKGKIKGIDFYLHPLKNESHGIGIEDLKEGKFKIFFWNGFERIYDLKEIELNEEFKKWKDFLLSILPDSEKEEIPKEIVKQTTAVAPDILSMKLLDKLKSLSTFERMLMFQQTHESDIYTKKGPGNKDLAYVKGNKMIQEANIAFLFNWSFEITDYSIGDKSVSVFGKLTTMIDGKEIVRSHVGVEELNSNVDAQHALKAATTDCIKKCLSTLGFNSDVYRGGI